MNPLIADCLITFGIGLQSVWLGMPASVDLIKRGHRCGWVGPATVVAGLASIAAGAYFYA